MKCPFCDNRASYFGTMSQRKALNPVSDQDGRVIAYKDDNNMELHFRCENDHQFYIPLREGCNYVLVLKEKTH